MARSARAKKPQPLEHSLLLTATFCLLAGGAGMVFSASSARTLLEGQGDGTAYLVKYVLYGAVGLVVMQVLARVGLDKVRRVTPLLLVVAFVLLVLVLVPGVGVRINGARRWLGAAGPIFLPGAAAVVLIAAQPDLGTALVCSFTMAAILVVGGLPLRQLGLVAAGGALLVLLFALVEPYRRARLVSFLDPWAHAGTDGFQSVQGQIAIGSGGLFGLGPGQSVQKIFYLPEAHTDFILAVIGEGLGLAGSLGLLALYGMIAHPRPPTAKAARDTYGKLLAAGITSLILCQALLNVYTVLGLAPLTGVPLPFISSGSTSLIVLLSGMGLLLNVAGGNTSGLRAVKDPARRKEGDARTPSRDRGRRDRRARGPGHRGGRRAAG